MDTNFVDPLDTNEVISLTEVVTAFLIQQGHPKPNAWLAGLDHNALLPGTPLEQQRFFINRYWRVQLGLINDPNLDTMNIRFYLVDNGSIKDWIRLFRDGVLPCIMKYKLPHGSF